MSCYHRYLTAPYPTRGNDARAARFEFFGGAPAPRVSSIAGGSDRLLHFRSRSSPVRVLCSFSRNPKRLFRHLSYPPSPAPLIPPYSIRTVVEAPSAALLPGSSQQPLPSSLSAAISAATKEIIEICDAHQSLRAARSLSSAGEGGGGAAGAGTGIEEMDRLASTASSLREAVGVLRRDGGSAGAGGAGDAAVAAGRQAMSAVKELAGLLASEVQYGWCSAVCWTFNPPTKASSS